MARLRVKTFNGKERERFEKYALRILENYLSPIFPDKDFEIQVPHNTDCSDYDNPDTGYISIIIWSCYRKRINVTVQPLARLYGRSGFVHDRFFGPTSQDSGGIVVRDPGSGVAVAEFVKDKLFILFDQCHHGNDDEEYIFHRIIEDLAGQLRSTEINAPDFESIRSNSMSLVPQISNELLKPLARKLETTEVESRDLAGKIKDEEVKLKSLISEENTALERLMDYEKHPSKDKDFYASEFNGLLEIEGVESVDIDDRYIYLYTDFMNIEHGKELYAIGKFQVKMPIHGNEDVLFINLTNNGQGPGHFRPSGYSDTAHSDFNRHHPHVNAQGWACLGNIKTALPEYLCNQKYAAAALLCILFLRSVNTDDSAGRGIIFWPKAR